jgi:hypothetical protein
MVILSDRQRQPARCRGRTKPVSSSPRLDHIADAAQTDQPPVAHDWQVLRREAVICCISRATLSSGAQVGTLCDMIWPQRRGRCYAPDTPRSWLNDQ